MWVVYVKELLELSRDKPALLTMILLPVLFLPLLMALAIGASTWVASQAQDKPLRYGLVDEGRGYQLVSLFNQQHGLRRVQLSPHAKPEQVVKDDVVDFVLVVKGELPEGEWTLYHNGAQVFSRAQSIIQQVKQAFVGQWQEKQLADQGLDAAERKRWLQPIQLNRISIADERETLGSSLGGFLPYLVLIVALSGAMYPAIDVGAGEKERGTLETLLMSPLPIERLVIGKVAVVATCAFSAAVLTLLSLSFWSSLAAFSLGIESIEKALQSFSVADFLVMAFLIVPVALIFGALMTAISFYARSFKEAQNYMGLAYSLPFIPLMVASIPGIELSGSWAMVPLSNVALAIKELTKGTLSCGYLLIIWVNSVLVATALIRLTIHWCRKESVLFR